MHIYAQIYVYMHGYTQILADIYLIYTDMHRYNQIIRDMQIYAHWQI